MTEQQTNKDFQTKIESIAKREDIKDIEKILSIRNQLQKAGKQVNNEQIANMVFCSKRSLLNALLPDRWEVAKRFASQSTTRRREVVYEGEETKGVILTLLDYAAQETGDIQVDFEFRKYKLHLKDKWEIPSKEPHLSDDILNRMLNCIVEGISKFEEDLLIYNIFGQRKDPTARHDYMQNMPPAKCILPPAYSSYITHTNDGKGYEMNCSPSQKLQELRANYDEFNTDNKNIFTSINKALEYTRIKFIHLNAKPGQHERSVWRAICLVPSPLYQKVQEDYSKIDIYIPEETERRVSTALSSLGLSDSDGFVHEQVLFMRTNLYVSWKDEDPVALCEKDGTTKWYQKNASGDGSEKDPAELLGKIPPGKEMYRLALIGADAIHYIYRHLNPSSSSNTGFMPDTGLGINKNVPPTDFTFIKVLWDCLGQPKNLWANPCQHTSMRRIRKKIVSGSQVIPEEDAGIFTIDLIAERKQD